MNAMRALLTGFAAALLAGCSVFGGGSEEPVEKPAELPSLPASALKARVLWRASAGQAPKKDYYGLRLALDERHLYAADGEGRISAFDPGTGRSAWRAQTQPRLAAGVGVSGSAVLAGTLDGEVIAVSADKGVPLWRAGVSSEVLTAPLGDADTVVVRTGDGRLYGLAAADGQRRWAFERSAPTLSLRGISQPVVADGRVYAGLDTGKLVALDLASGQLLWEESVSAPSGRSEIERLVDLDADPVLADGSLYAVSYGGQLIALDAASGKLRWRQALSSYSGLAVDGERVYASDRDGRVWALNRSSGTVLWQQEGLKHRQLTRPVVHDGLVAVGDFEGYVHWLSPEDGSLRGRLDAARSALVAPPLVSGSRLYLLGREGDIAAVELPGSG
jgi:outer membrane protein assembly factor BamB